MTKPTGNETRNLVICCDGTNNEIGTRLSNVLKLYKIAEKSDRQIAYYHPGIGTIAMPGTWGKWRRKASSLFEMMTGHGLDRDVLAAYCFLCRHYREGDRIFLFGFSRGAYTARVLAGMIYLVGLLRENQVNFAGYALKAYKRSSEKDRFATAREFVDVVRPQRVAIGFLGVWDTVASVIVPGSTPLSDPTLEELPFTKQNPAVAVFRHAMAIDEFRRMFRIMPWTEPQQFKPNPYSQAKSFPVQDCRQVWFAGCHSDVGGGFAETESALSKYPLIWMIEQARHHGLLVRTSMVNHIAYGRTREGARDYMKPDPAGALHRSLTWLWRSLEYFPKAKKYRNWMQRRALLGYYVPRGEPRSIAPNSLIHVSVIDRRKHVPAYTPINWPQQFLTETMTGPVAPPVRRRAAKAAASGSKPPAKSKAVKPASPAAPPLPKSGEKADG
jgi:uncharacterized protein (DUF2235 family)